MFFRCIFLPQERDQKPAYNLTVIAENSLASPKLSTNLTVQVIVYDVGVQRPQFTSSQYQAEVSESAAVGTSVIKVNVTNSGQVTKRYLHCLKIHLEILLPALFTSLVISGTQAPYPSTVIKTL